MIHENTAFLLENADLCQNQVNMRQNWPPHLSGDCTMKRPVIKVRPGSGSIWIKKFSTERMRVSEIRSDPIRSDLVRSK